MMCSELERSGAPIGSSVLTPADDVWKAIRKFFVHTVGTMEVMCTTACHRMHEL